MIKVISFSGYEMIFEVSCIIIILSIVFSFFHNREAKKLAYFYLMGVSFVIRTKTKFSGLELSSHCNFDPRLIRYYS